MQTANQNFSLKVTLFLLTFLIILLQFYLLSFKLPLDIAYTNKTVGFFAIYLSKLKTSFSLWPPLLKFISAHFFIQGGLASLIYYASKKIVLFLNPLRDHVFLVGISLWLICQVDLLLWNGYLFPYSFFSLQLRQLISPVFLYFLLMALCTLMLFVASAISIFKSIQQHKIATFCISGLIFLLLTTPLLCRHFLPKYHFKASASPNIIMIITDSLRPDYAKSQQATGPNPISQFVTQSSFFSNSFTLLGRSTPGLVAILTGNYPKINGARFNLIPSHYLHLEDSLTQKLKSVGYQTIFAADGRQFINLDKNFGFDQIISAKSGIYDFIFTLMNDTPLSNLLTNTPLGKNLFPYNYANRNAYYTYLPQTFVNLVDQQLVNAAPNKPIFLVAALTVAHWPYVWARQPNFSNLAARYEEAVFALDAQFGSLLALLDQRGLLKNSIMITLSDHGDSLGLPNDRIIQTKNFIGPKDRLSLITRFPYMVKTEATEALVGINTSAGHGTDLLSMTQLHTTLAIRSPHHPPHEITQRVALIDVMPTLLDLLHLPTTQKLNGISLKSLMEGKNQATEFNRPIFLESEIDIPLIDLTQPGGQSNVSRLINQYANLYDIDLKTQQLVLKDTAISRLLKEKQLGVMEGNWLLVYFPGKNRLQTTILPANSTDLKNCYYYFPTQNSVTPTNKMFCYQLSPTYPYFVLVNLHTQKWRILLPHEIGSDRIAKLLFYKLLHFYGDIK